MKKAFNRILNFSIISSLYLVGLGIFLFIKPDLANKAIGISLGALILLGGVFSVNKYIQNGKKGRASKFELVSAGIAFLLAIFILSNPLRVTAFITVLLGIFIFFSGLFKLQKSLLLKKYKERFWLLSLIVSIMHILFGGILVFDSWESTFIITKIIGLFIILFGILNIIEVSVLKNKFNKNFEKKTNKNVIKNSQVIIESSED